MLTKKGSSIKVFSAMLGIILTTISVYYFINDKILPASIFGIIGILIIALSLMMLK